VGFLDRLRQKRPSPEKVDEVSLKQLLSLGADLERPRHILHFLYFDDEADARSAADTTGAAGYETAVLAPDGQIEQWCVRAETTRVVNESTIRAFRTWFEVVASDHSGEYDGWEAAAKP
jgi:hypothetical protein